MKQRIYRLSGLMVFGLCSMCMAQSTQQTTITQAAIQSYSNIAQTLQNHPEACEKIDNIVDYTAEEIGKTIEKIQNDVPKEQQKELEHACKKEFESAAKKCETIVKYHHDKLESKIEKILGKETKEKIKQDCTTLATNVTQKAKDLKFEEPDKQFNEELKQASQPVNEAWEHVAEKALAPLIDKEDQEAND